MKDLMPESYFVKLQNSMVNTGFALISQVGISSFEREYHVPCTKARATTLFFHRRGKPLIIQMCYVEDDCLRRDDFRGYWQLHIYLRYKPLSLLLSENKSWLSMDNIYGELPILGANEFNIEGFGNERMLPFEWTVDNIQLGLKYDETDPNPKPMDPGIISNRLYNSVNTLLPYLDRARFYRLDISSFLPNNVFSALSGKTFSETGRKQLEEIFWPRFDWAYFRQIAEKPVGFNYRTLSRSSESLQAA